MERTEATRQADDPQVSGPKRPERPLLLPEWHLRAMAWLSLALGTAGFTAFCFFFLYVRMTMSASVLAITVIEILLIVAGGWGLVKLEARRRARDGDQRGQLFTADLITGSVAIAFYFGVFEFLAADYFVPYALWGGGVAVAAMLLALLRASRLGLLSGMPRAAFALGFMLILLGVGGTAPFAFFAIVMSAFNGIDRFIDFMGVPDAQPMNFAAISGAMFLAAGWSLTAWARRQQDQKTN